MTLNSLAFLLILLSTSITYAANLIVSPVKLILSPQKHTDILKFTNRDDKPIRLQIFLKSWMQDDQGKTVLADASDLIIYPKLLTIEPYSERPIRLGYQGEWPKGERAYRIFADELPDVGANQGAQIIMPLRVSIPIFLHGSEQKSKIRFELVAAEKSRGNLRVAVKNTGLHYFTVAHITAVLSDQQGAAVQTLKAAGWYVLPEKVVFFNLPFDEQTCLDSQVADLSVQVGKVIEDAQFTLASHACRAE